jgi:hypothetical protein
MQEVSGQYGWLGYELERKAKEVNYDLGLMLDFRQWSENEISISNEQIDLVKQFNFPFDAGFAFWPIVDAVYGKQVPSGPQTVGNCVPYGSCLANVDRMCVELLLDGEAESFFVPFVPYSYGAGRVYIGNVNWSSHGSLGSWQIAADMKCGLLPCDVSGVPVRYTDDMQGSANTNSSWMKSKAELDRWLPIAKTIYVGEGSEIKTFEQLKVAVCEKKQPVTIASNWGFVSRGLDSKYGIIIHSKGGSWAHQMHIRAVFSIKDQWFVYVGNQWGENYHPLVAVGFAPGGFVVPAELFDDWVKDAEVYVRGSINGRVFKPSFAFV